MLGDARQLAQLVRLHDWTGSAVKPGGRLRPALSQGVAAVISSPHRARAAAMIALTIRGRTENWFIS